MFSVDDIVVTPHLGASTSEAQVAAARDVAEQFVSICKGEPARSALNAPVIATEALAVVRPFTTITAKLGKLASQLSEGQVKEIKLRYEGEISNYETQALKAAVLGGLLEETSEVRVNLVNANIVAAQRGLSITELKDAKCHNYASLITVEITTSTGTTTVAGTVLRDESHIVRVNDYWMHIAPAEGYFLFSDHRDRPGLISAVSKVTGDGDVNISAMYVGRLKPRGQALMVLTLDEPLNEAQLEQVLSVPDVYTAKLVKL
jgi:D-3-phosphoglycerate dehydrogenase